MVPHVDSQIISPAGQGHQSLEVENRVVPRSLPGKLLGLTTLGSDLTIDSVGESGLGEGACIVGAAEEEVDADELNVIVGAVVVVALAFESCERGGLKPLDVFSEPPLEVGDHVLRPLWVLLQVVQCIEHAVCRGRRVEV